MASHPKTLKTHESRALDIPSEIWEEIISKLHHDRPCNLHLQSLSLVCKFFLSITNLNNQTLKISNPTSQFLPSLFHRFPNLKHISLSDFTDDPNPILLQIADFDFRLESLDLSNQECLPVEALEWLPVSTLIGVKSLNISSLSGISNDDLKIIAKLFPNLEEFDLSHCGQYSSSDELDDGIHVLASKLEGLRRINLNGNDWITDRAVKRLSKKCRNLEEIVVCECKFVTQTWISSVLRTCKNLKTFELRGEYRSHRPQIDYIGKRLCRALSLSVIDFTYMEVSDAFLLAMAKANLPLKSFSLIRCEGFTYDGISSFLTSYDSLDHFALKGDVDVVSDENMIILAMSLTKLTSVKLIHSFSKLSESTLFTLVEKCPLLETVDMKKITTRGKEGFAVGDAINPRIKTLDLSWSKNLSNEILERIGLACPNLETLRLKYCFGLSRKGFGRLKLRKFRGLKHLEIDGCIGVQSLHLGRKTHKLEFLSASDSGIDDKALIDIAEKCPNLMFLNVSGCKRLTSKGVLEVVEKCEKLKDINSDRCNSMKENMLPWMIFSRPSLRKVLWPVSIDHIDENLFMRYGCYVN